MLKKKHLLTGKGRGGFEPLPSAEPPALIAARKSRDQKNKIIIKIGAVVVLVTAAVATLAAFLITRGEHSQVKLILGLNPSLYTDIYTLHPYRNNHHHHHYHHYHRHHSRWRYPHHQ